MAVTQFIGPRQAPLWADPVEWNSTRTYEPYTFVTYQGDSYCTRQTVPIGIDITNGNYWVKVSDFNAQATAMQQSVLAQLEANETDVQNMITTAQNTIDTDIANANTSMNAQVAVVESVKEEFQDSLNQVTTNKNNIQVLSDTRAYKSNCLMIGNSFTVGYYTHNYGMARALQDIGYFDNIYWFTSDGSGFTNHESMTGGVDITDSNNFSALLTQASNSSTFENDSITTLIFNSAMGDTRAVVEGKTNISTSINSTITKARNLFPNAVIYIVYSEQILYQNTQLAYGSKYPMAQMRTHVIFRDHENISAPYIYIGWCGYGYNLFTAQDTSGFMPDGYHPTATRSMQLATNMLQMMNGKSAHMGIVNIPPTSLNANKFDGTSVLYFYPEKTIITGSCPEDIKITNIYMYTGNTEFKPNTSYDSYFTLSDGTDVYRRPVLPISPNILTSAMLWSTDNNAPYMVPIYVLSHWVDVEVNSTTYQSLRLYYANDVQALTNVGNVGPVILIPTIPIATHVNADLVFY